MTEEVLEELTGDEAGEEVTQFICALEELSVFAGLYEDPVFQAFNTMMQTWKEEGAHQSRREAAAFAAALYSRNTQDWAGYLEKLVLDANTCVAWYAGQSNEIPKLMLDAAMEELHTLSIAAMISLEDLYGDCTLAAWQCRAIDLQGEYLNRMLSIASYGYGEFAKANVFRVQEEKESARLVPIVHPDPVTFADLVDYDDQHEAFCANIEALLAGKPAANVLLYGDAGTGKSASVKAALNKYAKKGLRLVEISKNRLHLLPGLLDQLCAQPLKFVLFIDDLSFQEDDDTFSELKAVLEGSAAIRAGNTIICATSNRRHLVRETFKAREGDEVHRADTLQETLSLSERFGLKIYFEKPSKNEYLAIVRSLAAKAGLRVDPAILELGAERFAQRKSGRSARAARQYVELLEAQGESHVNAR